MESTVSNEMHRDMIFSSPNLTATNMNNKRPTSLDVSCIQPTTLETWHKNPRTADISNETLKPTNLTYERPIISDLTFRPRTNENPYVRSLLHTLEGSGSEYFPRPKEVALTRVDERYLVKLEKVPIWIKVSMGVFSGMIATATVHPLDVIKVRLQLFPIKYKTMSLLRSIMEKEGHAGLYTGLSAGILRQLTYTGARLYVYNVLFDRHKKMHGEYPMYWDRVSIAVVAGMVGAFIGTPSEVALVRIIEARRLRLSACSPNSQACKMYQRHSNAIIKLRSIARREGISTWWRGGVPTLVRSVFVTTAQTGVYIEIRIAFAEHGWLAEGPKLHVCTAMCSSLISAVLSLPVDQVKTRYQSLKEKSNYKGILKDLLKNKGVKYFWKGFWMYYSRQAIHTMISYTTLEYLIDSYIAFKEADVKK